MYRILRFPDWKDKAMTLSYDDGVCYDEHLIRIMQKYGLKGTFNVNAGCMTGGRRMDEKTAFEVYKDSGMEIGMHGLRHLLLTSCTKDSILNEFYQDKVELERIFGSIVRGGAYPFGKYNDESINVLKCLGVKYFRTIKGTNNFDLPKDWLQLNPTCHHSQNILGLLDKFVAEQPDKIYCKQPKLFYLWGHSYEFNDENNWEIIEEFGEKVAEHNDIWHATNIEIYDYVKAYDDLVISTKGDKILNNSSIDVYLWADGKNVLAKAGQITEIELL